MRILYNLTVEPPYPTIRILAVLLAFGVGTVASTVQAQYVSEETFVADNLGNDDFFGRAVAEVGTTGGVSVLVVGAPGTTNPSNGRIDGRAYLVDGNAGTIRHTLTTPNSTNNGQFGAAVGVVGDVTGDGFPDVIVGAPREDVPAASTAGTAHIYNGDTGAFVKTLQTSTSNITSGRRFGSSVAGVGDVTGDGTADVVVGAPDQAAGGQGQAGKVYLFSGSDGSVIDVLAGAGENGGKFGTAVAGVGNLVGDDTPDFAVGAFGESVSGSGSAGRVYLFDGDNRGQTEIVSPNVETGGQFGRSIASIGQDFVVGAPAEDGGGQSDAGRAYVVDGANPTGTPVTLISGQAETQGAFGRSVGGIDDVSGDGVPDVIVGSPLETVGGTAKAGRAYVLNSATGVVIDRITSPRVEDGRFGTAVAGASTPIVGAPREDVSGTSQAGRVHTFRIPEIAFVDGRNGETYDPAEASANDTDVPVGRFKLTTDDARSALQSVTVSNQGTTVSGVNTVELWASTDNTFDAGGDTQLQQMSYSGTATFSSVGESLSTGGTYFFVVVDLGSSPSGEYDPAIASEADISVANGQLATVNGAQATTFSVADGEGYLSTGSTSPLPVELTRLEATASAEGVALEWRTASEQNNAGFRVQRRVVDASAPGARRVVDGASEGWSRVGRVDGSGTTSSPQTYRFADDDLPAGADTLQYRLAQVDLDGTVNLSDPVTVGRGAPSGVKLLDTYPNPARTRATVALAVPEQASGGATLRLYDVLGRQVRTVDGAVEPGRSTATVDVSGLPSGVYVLRLAADGTTRTRRLTVVK